MTVSYPHCPQVFPQGKTEKPPEKPGVFRGKEKIHLFLHKTVENFLVYRTPLKFQLRGKNPGMSLACICI